MFVPRPAPRQRGAAAVEFAFVLPILLLLVFGIVQYGLYLWSLQGGSSAARVAARTAAVGGPVTCSALDSSVEEQLGAVSSGNVTVSRSYDAGTPVSVGDEVTITVTFDSVNLGVPFVPIPSGGRIVQSVDTRVEYVPNAAIGDC